MLCKVKLLGKLGQKYGREFVFDLHSHIDAFKALAANFPDFWSYLIQASEQGIGYSVITQLAPKEFVQVTEETLDYPACPTLIVAPVVAGSGGVGRIIAGAAIFAIGTATGGIGFLGLSALNFQLVGAALILSGVSQLLSPTPKEEKKRESFAFSGVTNTSAPGQAVAVCYGKFLVGSHVISSGISTSRVVN